MKIAIATSAILLASIPSASTAQLERRDTVGSGEIGPGVPIDPSIRPAIRLATNDFGAYISEISGYPGRPTLRRGTRLVIIGRGFGTRNARSLVAFFVPRPPSGYNELGYLFTISSWSDTRVVAELPLDMRGPDYDGPVLLKLQGVRPDNFFSTLNLPNVRFIPG